jgi:threonine aldolase
MGAEAVVFFRKELSKDFLYWRKQGMQLASKMRFISVQLETILANDLWLRSAQRSNQMARLLEAEVRRIPQAKIVYPVEGNGVFVQLPKPAIAKIQQRYFFYNWNEKENVVRWMCSFDTTEDDIRQFSAFVKEMVAEG